MRAVPSLDLDEAVRLFLEAAALPELMPEALDALARSMGARGALLATPRFVKNFNPVSRGIEDSFNAYIEEGWDRRDIRSVQGARWHAANGAGFFCEDMLFSRDEIRRSEYFNGFGTKHDVPWFAAAPLITNTPSDYVALSFNRRAKEGAFTGDEIHALNRTLPTLRAAALLCAETFSAHEQGMLAGLDLVSKPAFLINDQEHVVQFNQRAAEIFGDRISVRNGRLSSKHPNSQEKIDRAVNAAVKGGPGGAAAAHSITLEFGLKQSAVVLQFIPIIGQGNDIFRRARVLALISTPTRTLPDDMTARLATLFGLTLREAEVAALLVDGRSINDIAELLPLSVDTVRFHVKRILAKSDTHRQSEFIRYVLTVMSD